MFLISKLTVSKFMEILSSNLAKPCIDKLWKKSLIVFLDISESPPQNIFKAAINWVQTNPLVLPQENFDIRQQTKLCLMYL